MKILYVRCLHLRISCLQVQMASRLVEEHSYAVLCFIFVVRVME